MTERNAYDVLGVDRTASAAEIRMAWKRLAAQLHPDRNPDPTAGDRLAEVNRAYERLSDPEGRRRYDETGQHRVPDPKAKVVAVLLQAASAALDQWKPNHPGMAPTLLGQVRAVILQQQAQFEQQLNAIDATATHLRKVRGKLKSTGDNNLFHGLIDQKLDSLERNREAVALSKSQVVEAGSLLADYSEDDWGERMAMLSGTGNRSTMFTFYT